LPAVAHRSIEYNRRTEILKMEKQIFFMQQKIRSLEKKVSEMQSSCCHIFYEADGYRTCTKCSKSESVYY
jgi:hypothetical protein